MQPSAHLRRDGALPCKVVITSNMHYIDNPRGFSMVKPLNLSTLNSQLKCTVSGVGASENPKNLEQKRKHTGRTTIHET